MTEHKNYSGLLIGTFFTIGSLLLTITFIVPIISVLPGVLLESISAALISNEPYSNVGRLTIFLLSIVLLLILLLSILFIWRTAQQGLVSKGRIIFVMSICYFIVHSLGFYCYWGIKLDFRSDGQLIFGAVQSFPVSSFAFVLIGLLIDLVKNKAVNTSIAAMQAN